MAEVKITAKPKNEVALNDQLAMSERFTNKVLKEFGGKAGEIEVTEYQRKLIQGYFIGIDRGIKIAEDARVRKNKKNKDHKYDNTLVVSWANVNLGDLALDVVHYARMGLDMMSDNHLSPIPYKDNKTNLYDMNLMPGYNGIQYIAEKYALDKPVSVTIELVCENDKFRPIKKSVDKLIENYMFEIVDAFDRGDIKGGFIYIEYKEPQRNKLIVMTMADIEKRKPQYAAAEFWGGMVKKWVDGKQIEVETDGWFAEMCLKTLKREAYSAKNMPRDPEKIDENYQYMKMKEAQVAHLEAEAEITENANVTFIDTSEEEETEGLANDEYIDETFAECRKTDSTELTKEEQAEIAKAEKSGARF